MGLTTLAKVNILVWCAVFISQCLSSKSGDDIAAELRKFANDGLGVQEFQDYLDSNVIFQNVDLNAEQLAKQIAESMSAKLQVRIEALTGLKQDIESMYSDVTRQNRLQHCCQVPVYEKDPLLNTEVNYNEICVVGKHLSEATEFLPALFSEKMKKQYQKALGIKYAYFGSAEGVLFNYPSSRFCNYEYDPRFRPWYVEASTPRPKDLVIIIDKSGSMGVSSGIGGSLMDVAKKAAITVMETLNPNDRVGIVAFSIFGEVPAGNSQTSTCYDSVLAKATSQNKDYLKTYVTGLRATGSTYYNRAMKIAFQYFDNTPVDMNDTRNRDRVILFLTDGLPTEGTTESIFTEFIAAENAKLNNSVTVLTYGLGNGVLSNILVAMANQTLSDPLYGAIKRGVYTHVTNPTNLRMAMASYYEQFKHGGESQVVFTAPYMDAFGSGLLISLCLPVNYQNTVKGVTCMDLSVDDMLSDITYFREGESSYGFIVDYNSRVLTHPLLAFPSEVTNNPYFIYLDTLESVPGIDEILTSMKSGGNGTKVTVSRRIIPRGNVQLEGIYTTSSSSTYSWYPVIGTGFSICLVITDRDQKATIQMSPPYPTYVYHRLDLSSSSLRKCSHFNRLSINDTSSLTLAARSFTDPFLYLNTEEIQNSLNEYEVYLTGASNRNPGFKDGVRETVAATAIFDNIMKARTDYVLNSVWRYVSTDNGVHRVFPAVEIPKTYDPTRRSWYLRAKAHKGVNVISTPYEDAFGAGTVVTLSHVLFEGNKQKSHSAADKTIGVMGVDFTLQHFYYVSIGKIPQCEIHTCFIVDNAGYIVVHKDWIILTDKSTTTITNIHISMYEPSIATELINRNAVSFTHDACVNLEEFRDQYFWKISSTTDIIHSDFEFHNVPKTNVFLVIRKKLTYYLKRSCQSCLRNIYLTCEYNFKSKGCFCPCYERANIYRYCAGVFDFSGDTHQPCTPPLPNIDFSHVNRKDLTVTKTLQQCYNYDCENPKKSNASSCSSVVTCSWCQFYEDGDTLETPFCTTQIECPNGRFRGKHSEKGGGSSWWISILAVCVVMGVIFFTIRKKKQGIFCKRQAACQRSPANPSAAYTVPATGAGPTAPQAPPLAYVNAGADIPPPQNIAPPAYGDIYPSEKVNPA